MEEWEQMDEPMRDLIEIIHFTENVSSKIHGVLDEAEIYRTVRKEFAKSKRYTASILLLTDDGSKLRIAETSLPPGKLKAGEKAAGFRLKGYKIDLNKSSTYSQVVRGGKTVQSNVGDVIGELFPRPLAHLVSKTMGYEKIPSIQTPLKRRGEIIGALAISSIELTEHFIPSVRNLAQHISNALELADEYAEHKRAEEELRKYRLHLEELVEERTAELKKINYQLQRDITERKRTEEALASERHLLNALMDNIPDTIYFKDTASRFTRINRAQAQVLGVSDPKEAIGKTDFDFFTAEHARDAYADEQKIVKSGQPLIDKVEKIRRADGQFRWISTTKVPVMDKEGRVTGIVGISRDITERKRNEDQIRRHREELEEAVERRTARIQELERQRTESEKLAATGRMAARIAHEINNPLAGIKNSFLLIKDAIPEDHPYYEYVSRIEKEIKRIARIVRQMFDLYRPDQELAREFQVDEAIHDIVALLQPRCREHDLEITVGIPEAPVVACLPESLVRQVLYNIFQNALEASPPGGVVKIATTVSDGHLTITVSDQGNGIPEEIRSRIFEPFFTTKNGLTTGGLGLGLSVSKRVVESMRGSLDFESKTGQGTVFRIRLPIDGVRKEEQNGRFGANLDRRRRKDVLALDG